VHLLKICLILLISSTCYAQTATWRGRTYTPQSFPRAKSCSCRMCQALRAQWSNQAVHRGIRQSEARSQPIPPAASGTWMQAYRTETRTRQVPYTVRVCIIPTNWRNLRSCVPQQCCWRSSFLSPMPMLISHLADEKNSHMTHLTQWHLEEYPESTLPPFSQDNHTASRIRYCDADAQPIHLRYHPE